MDTNSAERARSRSGRRWFQYRLRTLLILVAAIGAACAYVQHLIATYEAEWHEEDAAIARINTMFQRAPGRQIRVNRTPCGPAWLRALVPKDRRWIFDRVDGLELGWESSRDRNETEQLIDALIKLPFLKTIFVIGPVFGRGRAEVNFDEVRKALPNVDVSEYIL